MKHTLRIALLSATLLAGNAYAQDAVPVLSGGIGMSERETIKQQQDNYSLKLVFTGQGGMFLSQVGVVIRDMKGQEVVNSVAQGPILLADLKPGKYTVESATEGFNKKQTVQVGEKLRTYQINFPVADTDNPAASAEMTSIGQQSYKIGLHTQ